MRSIRCVTEPGRDTIDRTNVREMVDQNSASWKRTVEWLQLIEGLKTAA